LRRAVCRVFCFVPLHLLGALDKSLDVQILQREFCQTRQNFEGIIALFQENLTMDGEILAKRWAFMTLAQGP